MPTSPTSFRYGPLEVYKGKGGRWFWRLRAANNKIVADGSQGYGRPDKAIEGFKTAYSLGAAARSAIVQHKGV